MSKIPRSPLDELAAAAKTRPTTARTSVQHGQKRVDSASAVPSPVRSIPKPFLIVVVAAIALVGVLVILVLGKRSVTRTTSTPAVIAAGSSATTAPAAQTSTTRPSRPVSSSLEAYESGVYFPSVMSGYAWTSVALAKADDAVPAVSREHIIQHFDELVIARGNEGKERDYFKANAATIKDALRRMPLTWVQSTTFAIKDVDSSEIMKVIRLLDHTDGPTLVLNHVASETTFNTLRTKFRERALTTIDKIGFEILTELAVGAKDTAAKRCGVAVTYGTRDFSEKVLPMPDAEVVVISAKITDILKYKTGEITDRELLAKSDIRIKSADTGHNLRRFDLSATKLED